MPSTLPQDDGASVFYHWMMVQVVLFVAVSCFAARYLCQDFYFLFLSKDYVKRQFVATLVFPEDDAASVYFAFMART